MTDDDHDEPDRSEPGDGPGTDDVPPSHDELRARHPHIDPADPFAAWRQPEREPDEGDAGLTMTRLRERGGRMVAAILALLLVLPVGAWMVETLVFRARGEAVAEAVPELAEAVALVTSRGCDGLGGSGSGFAMVLDDVPVLVTNRHVVEGSNSVGLRTLDGAPGPLVEEVFVSRTQDVAVLVLEEPMGSALALGRTPAPGAEVRLVGFPGAQPVTSAGSITSLSNDVAFLSMRVDPGASGAPVVDADGAVVAQIRARTDEGDGVATPSAAIAEGLRTLVELPPC